LRISFLMATVLDQQPADRGHFAIRLVHGIPAVTQATGRT
jgi:hypothetical protein